MNRNKKALLSIAGVGLAAAVTVTGCGTSNSGTNGTSGSSGKTENITFTWWTTPTRTKMTKKAVQLFEKKYPNIHVTMTYASWSGYWQKLATEAAGGNLPDVMQMDASYLGQYISQGSLKNLTSTSIDTSGLSKSVADLGKVNGKLYAVPVAINTFCNIYNPALLKKAGISFDPTKNYTWNQFANILIQVHNKLPNVYGSTNNVWQGAELAYWATSHGEREFKNGKIGMSQQTLTNWFQYWLNLEKKGGVPSAQKSSSYTHSKLQDSPFVKKKAAFTYMPIGEGPTYQKLLGKPIQRVLFPDWNQSSKPYILHPAMYWTISSKSKHPAAAMKLVNFLENNPQVSKTFGNNRGVTANNKNRSADAASLGGVTKVQDKFMAQVEKISTPLPIDPPNAGPISTKVLKPIAQKVMFGQLTPAQGAKEFIKQANQTLSQK
ncbi:ABC transporter substrate-binding protein [Alicyclobacillus sp. SO9]|uniref:ABC transporter substrate-binding protein n=1 Tax=Alicyclobacillus sp. SO9 TaxID=2665646 RepID=UPI0018E8469B|nr:ABC transporter substrate-binding protein [Alicyclobacillus sp. SO9]QQE77913.1 carbohydrate ABC transporter substrate-binding protein [Alicyclobacillus sp. SO9]